ncbi:hypothetical protein CEE37_00275 [candidate division LCP-89 bacterium B3_LCP]|uniref:histidine kinase n=1 Tax=candidate division LCP-89 bacterium B3_LCP TaxID=2012998 RepID=A0A532V4L9_UNCL8|nr:MAG: hypothetical protein CEE37_00275 [candidate division LCP-89 bacterium B3_LCP]
MYPASQTTITNNLRKMQSKHTPTVLLVDDNKEFLDVTEKILREITGYNVLTLADGRETIQVATTQKPDVIVLDVYMPGRDGPDICRQLKGTQELDNIPVLLLTGGGNDAQFRARCLEDGADDFLMKPADSDELIARVNVLLRIKALQDELRRERDELEEKVQARARELEKTETLAAIGKMVAGVAHEIRNPLGAISNSAAVLSRDLILEGEDHKLMDIIVQESNRLRDTITDFLTFAHPPPYNFTLVNLRELVEDVILLAGQDTLCGDEVVFQADIEDYLPEIEIDRDRIHQVLWNLIRNALEATGERGEIAIRVFTQLLNRKNGVVIQIVDDGSGIPDEDVEHIFAPFFTRKAKGSGLGLSMVQSAVKAHCGTVRVQNDDTGGAVFKVWLPVRQG